MRSNKCYCDGIIRSSAATVWVAYHCGGESLIICGLPPSQSGFQWYYKGFIWVQAVMTKYNGIWLTLYNIFVMRWVIFYLNICYFKTHQPHCHNIYTLYIYTKGGFELSAWNTNPSPSIIFWDLKQCLACFSSYIPMACYMLFLEEGTV